MGLELFSTEKRHFFLDKSHTCTPFSLPYSIHSKPPTSSTSDQQEQEIEVYYDTNTREEMMEKEDDGAYQQRKKARNKWRNVNRIATVAKAYAKEMAQDMMEAQKAAKQASSNLRSSVKSALDNQPKSPVPAKSRPSLGPIPRASKSGGDLTRLATVKKTVDVINKSNAKFPPRRSKSSVSKSTTSATESTKRAPPRRTQSSVSKSTTSDSKPATTSKPALAKVRPRRASISVANTKQAMTAAVQKETQAAPARRTPPRSKSLGANTVRAKTLEELAKEKEEADRRAAVERSKREAAQARAEAKAKK